MHITGIIYFATISAEYVFCISLAQSRHKTTSGNDKTIEHGNNDNNYDYNYGSYEDYVLETFSCTDNRGEIALILLCDGFIDCLDGSDEDLMNCNDDDTRIKSSFPPSTATATTSRITAQEIVDPAIHLLDDYGDYPSCIKGEFQCLSDWSVCVPANQVCDGIEDCPDKEDELNCFGCSLTKSYQCRSRPGDCVPSHLLCDSFRDCPDGSDEERCGCGSGAFTCINGLCVDASKRCDETDDCGDHSDEILGCVSYLPVHEQNLQKETEAALLSSSTKSTHRELTKYSTTQAYTPTAQRTSVVLYSYISEDHFGICDLLPCANEGVCLEISDHFHCVCQSGYAGPTCLQLLPSPTVLDSSAGAKSTSGVLWLSLWMSSVSQL